MIDVCMIGNAQTIGRRSVQSNYFSTLYNNEKNGDFFAVLADGSIDHPNGRRAAIFAVEYSAWEFKQKSRHIKGDRFFTEQFFLETAIDANRLIHDYIYFGRTPCLSLTMALFTMESLYYFSVGANRIYAYDGYREESLDDTSRIDDFRRYTFGEYKFDQKINKQTPKITIGLFSEGAHISLHPMERIKIISSKNYNTFDKAQYLVQTVIDKNFSDQLNTSIVLIDCF